MTKVCDHPRHAAQIADRVRLRSGHRRVLTQPQTAPARPGTLAIVNAKVWTGDDAQPSAEALVIDGTTLALVGTNEDARKANAEQVIDAGGRLIVPGFTDAHVHFLQGGHRCLRAAARCEHARGVRRAHQSIRGDGACRHVDHRRQLGSQPVGRRVADARVDRCGDAGSPGVDQPSRWTHVARE